MSKNPLVSIIINNFNKEKYCTNAINSVVLQNYKNYEVIFFDDKSTDNSVQKVKKFLKKKNITKVKILINGSKKDKHHVYNQNNAIFKSIKKCKGKIICLLDSDDFFVKSKIKKVVSYFENNISSDIVFDHPIKIFKNKYMVKKKIHYKKRFNKWPYFPPTSCISLRRKSLNKILSIILIKKFNELAIDFRLATFFSLKKNQFSLIDEFLTYYSQNETSYDRSRYKKFINKNWWVRRSQAFEFIKYLDIEKYKKNIFTFDFLITKLLNKFIF
tara:strand:- start:702 stop:1517 length:816 start_codon:yes stop_codon:yes gene_type:complete